MMQRIRAALIHLSLLSLHCAVPSDQDDSASVEQNVTRAPIGYLDGATTTRLVGWARDDDFAGPIAVHFYGEYEHGSAPWFIGATTANRQREPAVGAHGFEFVYQAPLGTSKIYAYAINVDRKGNPVGGNILLTAAPRLVPNLPRSSDPTCWLDLNAVWRTRIGNTNYMSTNSIEERDRGTTHDGQILYSFRDAHLPGTAPLNRLSVGFDHMDSVGTSEGPYVLEGPLGYFPTTPTPGMVSVGRRFNPVTLDHLTTSQADLITPAGYDPVAEFGRYGYPRFNREGTPFSTVSYGGTRVESNRAAGGAIWHWYYNGVQYVNSSDFGRLVQSTLFYNTSGRPGGGCNISGNPYVNPTEAGDSMSGCDHSDPSSWFGSPLAMDVKSQDGLTHSTRAIPLDFNTPYLPCDKRNYPRIYKDMLIGKDLTLNFNGWDNVSKYVTVITLPKAIPGSEGVAVEMPTAYLTGWFNDFYTLDAGAGDAAVAQRANVDANGWLPNYHPRSGYGGIIAANGTSESSAAFGFFSTIGTQNSQAWAQDLTAYSVVTPNQPNGDRDGNTTKLGVVRYPSQVPAGTSRYNAWVVTGTRQNVVQRMKALYEYCQTHGKLACE